MFFLRFLCVRRRFSAFPPSIKPSIRLVPFCVHCFLHTERNLFSFLFFLTLFVKTISQIFIHFCQTHAFNKYLICFSFNLFHQSSDEVMSCSSNNSKTTVKDWSFTHFLLSDAHFLLTLIAGFEQ